MAQLRPRLLWVALPEPLAGWLPLGWKIIVRITAPSQRAPYWVGRGCSMKIENIIIIKRLIRGYLSSVVSFVSRRLELLDSNLSGSGLGTDQTRSKDESNNEDYRSNIDQLTCIIRNRGGRLILFLQGQNPTFQKYLSRITYNYFKSISLYIIRFYPRIE